MSAFLIIIALLTAALVCDAEGAESVLVVVLAVAAFAVALLTELGVSWRARR